MMLSVPENRPRFRGKVWKQEKQALNAIKIKSQLKFGTPIVDDAENLSKNARLARANATAS